MKKTTFAIVLVAVLVIVALGGFILVNGRNNASNTTEQSTANNEAQNNNSQQGSSNQVPQPAEQKAKQASEVTIENFAYTPATITVKKGTTVTWTNQDDVRHDVAADSGAFKSELLAKGQSFSFTFDEAGTFKYHCTPHPNMIGTVIVE